MRSALYYPHTDVRSEGLMKSALLTWDKLHSIIPHEGYRPDYGDNRLMVEAWELIGEGLVVKPDEQKIAHANIENMLKAGLPLEFNFLANQDKTGTPYEIWPQKFAMETWQLMQAHQLTPSQLPNGDYPFTHEGGVMVMSKLADAMAGKHYARVTDQSLAFGMTANYEPDQATEQAVVMTLDLVDANRLSLKELIKFRSNEDRHGYELRQNYLKAVEAHVAELKTLTTMRQIDDKNHQFKRDMQRDLITLGEVITGNKLELVLKPVIVTTLVAIGAGVAAATGGGAAALVVAGTMALGATATEVADKLSKIVEQGFGYNKKQREAMAKHPMAYMYQAGRA